MDLIVLLADDTLPIEAARLQDRAHIVHHRFQAADEHVHIPTLSGSLEQVRLHVAGASSPVWFGTAERRPEVEIGAVPRQLLKLFAIEQTAFIANAEDQRELVNAISRQLIEQHGAKWNNA